MFLQYVRLKPHTSSLTNEENLTSNFQTVQICCGENEREKNDDNCKAFCVTRKRKKQLNESYQFFFNS